MTKRYKMSDPCPQIESRLHDMPDILHAIKRAEERRHDAYVEMKDQVERALSLLAKGDEEGAKSELRSLALILQGNITELFSACSDFDILSSLRKKEDDWGPFDDG